jgi:nitrogen fixation NifU-like protein
MFEYSEKVMDHFANPRNVGELENPDGVGRIGNPSCGDIMEFQIKVDDDRISDVKFRTFGCGAAIAVSSMVSEMAKGKTLDDAMEITNRMVAAELDGLPKNKLHCSNLGADALHEAIENYRERQAGLATEKPRPEHPEHIEKVEETEAECRCPYCDIPVEDNPPFCGGCGTKLSFCRECGRPIPRMADTCPECGEARSSNQ